MSFSNNFTTICIEQRECNKCFSIRECNIVTGKFSDFEHKSHRCFRQHVCDPIVRDPIVRKQRHWFSGQLRIFAGVWPVIDHR